ncbi:hypothetical protein CK203_106991 [Vitis vinifera]|uniref:Uncharacterized protein n=1 Tax=Vitis vinifera TaxID=29760 RepID=A0A438CW07_VITVI|nr:hypothetical protein CK203_106991 [Vitis vinifera]
MAEASFLFLNIIPMFILQALLASGYSQGNYEEAQQVIYKVLEMGLATGIALAVILFLGFGHLLAYSQQIWKFWDCLVWYIGKEQFFSTMYSLIENHGSSSVETRYQWHVGAHMLNASL